MSAEPKQTNSSLPNAHERLIELITPLVSPLGYEIVHLEVQTHRQKILRLFIDHAASKPDKTGIGVGDCVAVTKALDEPLDQLPELDAIFHGAYELEVSSPGVDRPLRQPKDYERFAGQEVRIHVFRPLTADEIANPGYLAKNPKQKNFLGVLKGLRNEKVLLALSAQDGTAGKSGKKGKAKKASLPTNSVEDESSSGAGAPVVCIPLPLIAKANLEPHFELGDERE